ncbi:MAG: hypothetical protein AAGM22_17730 [Acidobacteriota bacterium]
MAPEAESAGNDGRKHPRRRAPVVVWNLFASLALVGLIELGFYLCLLIPSLAPKLPETLRLAVAWIYHEEDRRQIHHQSEWHPLVTYTLEPESVRRIDGREFSVELRANSLGFRDDESSLDAPEVVVLGDSFAMGFGVEASETFAGRLEVSSGLKVLNTGLESYGTARQVLTFNRRIDTSQVRWIVVQYCDNDLGENLSFLRHGGDLPVRPEAEYRAYADSLVARQRYRPFDFIREAWRAVQVDRRPLDPAEAFTERELERLHGLHARAFLEVLRRLEIGDRDVQLVALDLWDWADIRYLRRLNFRRGVSFNSQLFTQAVSQELREGDYPGPLQEMILLDTSSLIVAGDRFHIDGHLQASGHRRIAEALGQIIDGEGPPPLADYDFITTAAERRGQLLTDPLPPAASASRLACPGRLSFRAGEVQRRMSVDLANRSGHWWPAHVGKPGVGPIRIRSHLLGVDGAVAVRDHPAVVADLPRSIGPGERLRIDLTVAAGALPPGRSLLELDVVQEGVAWFGDRGGTTCRVEVERAP